MTDDGDYLAVESTFTESVDGRNTATWEHEDLAQVLVFEFPLTATVSHEHFSSW